MKSTSVMMHSNGDGETLITLANVEKRENDQTHYLVITMRGDGHELHLFPTIEQAEMMVRRITAAINYYRELVS